MADGNKDEKAAGIPDWQKRETEPDPTEPALTPESNLEVARRFLQQDDVKHSSREKKVEFLRQKGLKDEEINSLLDAEEAEATPKPTEQKQDDPIPTPTASASQPAVETQPQQSHDHPPIITYPEFLAKPPRPPPLVTPDGVLATLYGLAGLSTLLYGTQKYVVTPMVDSLSDARHALFDTTLSSLGRLIEGLERGVSEVPVSITAHRSASKDDDDLSEADDPSELFHRDVGTQTLDPKVLESQRSAQEGNTLEQQPPLERQLGRLTELVGRLQSVARDHVSQAEELADVRAVAGVVQDDVVELAAAASTALTAEWTSSWSTPRKEPDDEIRKVKDSIRRLKGTLLSTRSFPARQGP